MRISGPASEDQAMKTLRVASVQFEHAPGDKAANLATVRGFVERAAAEKVEVICLPECCISGYWHLRHLSRDELVELAEPVPEGPSCAVLKELAGEHGMIVGAGLVEVADDGAMYNTYIIAMPDGTIHRHRKIHCFISEHLSSGDQFTVFDTPQGWRIGVLICYDCNLVENVRINALMGVDLLLAPHQTGGCVTSSPHTMGMIDRALWDRRDSDPQAIEAELRGDKGRGWLMRWLPARAHDNGLFVAFSNGVGPDDDEVRTGNAMILDPNGRIVAETWKSADDMVVADLDPSLFDGNVGRQLVATRRPELYQPLTVPTGNEQDTRTVRFSHLKP